MPAIASMDTMKVSAAILATMVNWKRSIQLHSIAPPIHANLFRMINCIIIFRTGTTNRA